ncbi:hypothetical protein CaCOL14_010901 [Colletotrichum acutatum]
MNGSTPSSIALDLVGTFASALKANDAAALENCFFAEQAYWKDQLALTYHLRTFQRAAVIASSLMETKSLRGLAQVEIDGVPTFAPVTPTLQFIDCNFAFRTASPAARCSGKIILLPHKRQSGNEEFVSWKIWVLSTRIEDFVYYPEKLSLLRGPAKQLGILEQFETDVIIIGGGNSAVTVAARLKALGVESVMLDRNPTPGDNWALRYHAMKFHIPTAICTMAYLEQQFPHFLTREELANQVKRYVEIFNLSMLNSAKIISTTYNQAPKLYTVTFLSPTGRRVAVARHIVQATGIGSQKPHMPPMADANLYRGVSVHSTAYRNAKDLKMLGVKSALVIGSANTAFDILEDCYAAGLKTTMVVRSPTYIFPVAYVCDPAAHGNYEKLGVEADKDSMAMPTNIDAHLVRGQFSHFASQEPDRYTALAKAGFPVLDSRSPECCLMVNLFEKGGGHYLDVGGTALISEGKAGVKANVEPVAFTATGLKFSDESTLDADAVVWCTGFADRDAPISQEETKTEKADSLDLERLPLDLMQLGASIRKERFGGFGNGSLGLTITGSWVVIRGFSDGIHALWHCRSKLNLQLEFKSEVPIRAPRLAMSSTNGSITAKQCEHLEELQNLFITALRTNVPSNADALEWRYRRTMTDFMWRQVHIEETQFCLRQLVEIADEERIRNIFAKFLTAATESQDQKTETTDTLCRILGIGCLIETNKRKPYEIWCASNNIMREAEICFEGNEEKTWFLADRIPSGVEVGEESMAMRKQVKTFVASESKLSELVSEYYELCVDAGTVVAQPASTQDVCSTLSKLHSDSTILPGTSRYDFENTYSWISTVWLGPACVFAPTSAEDVSAAVKLFTQAKVPFVVRAGGGMTEKSEGNGGNPLVTPGQEYEQQI